MPRPCRTRVPDRPPDRTIGWERGPGVVLDVDADDLVEHARVAGVVLRLLHRVGDFVPSGAPAVEVWLVDDRTVLGIVGVGVERTMTQDPMFGFRQLVDIAEKALSPAVNDPTTAVQALHRLP